MHYAEIKKVDVANGTGVRVSLFVSGCTHHCPGCFNEETWDFSYGKPFTPAVEEELLAALDHPYIAGLTLLGGEPMEPEHQRVLLPFLQKVRKRFPEKDIWCYSGYTIEELLGESRAHCEATRPMLELMDVLVDGEFVQAQKDITLKFKGSANQRIILLGPTLETEKIVLSPLNEK